MYVGPIDLSANTNEHATSIQHGNMNIEHQQQHEHRTYGICIISRPNTTVTTGKLLYTGQKYGLKIYRFEPTAVS